MVTLSHAQAVGLGVVLALWLAAAAWMLLAGLRLRAGAEGAAMRQRRSESLGELSPALAMVVRPDGQLEGSRRLWTLMGAAKPPRRLSDLSDTFSASDVAALSADIELTRRTGKSFARTVKGPALASALRFLGRAAPSHLGDGAVLLWVYDNTTVEEERAGLKREAERANEAFHALAQLIEAAPVPMWHRGPDLRLSLVNRAYVAAVDANSADDVIARGVELVDVSTGQGPIAAAAVARDRRETQERVVPATIGGQRRSVRIVDVPLGDVGVAGYALDNDELERARADFRRFVETQRDTLDRLSAGVAQFAADRTLAFSNLPFQNLFGLKPEWVSDQPEFDRVLDRMRETGRVPEARDFPAWKAEKREWFVGAGGATEESWLLPAGVHVRVVAQPLPDGGLLLIFEDRTEQVQLASARDTLLRVREATFDNLFEAVGVFAADGRLQLWNSRFRDVWGFDEAMLRTYPRVDLLSAEAASRMASPGRAEVMRELVSAATTARESRNGRIALKDGRHFEYAGVPLPDGNALFTMLDITDSRRIERVLRERADALEASDKVKTAFVSNMSYELRTPLTSIGGFAEMLAAGYAGQLPERAGDYVQSILAAVAKLRTQVDDVLHMAQSEAGLAPGDRERVDLVPILNAIADVAQTRAQAAGREFRRDIDGGVGRAAGDPRALRSVLVALLDRMFEGEGSMLLSASGSERSTTIIVQQKGGGATLDAAAVADARRQLSGSDATVSLRRDRSGGATVTLTLPR